MKARPYRLTSHFGARKIMKSGPDCKDMGARKALVRRNVLKKMGEEWVVGEPQPHGRRACGWASDHSVGAIIERVQF